MDKFVEKARRLKSPKTIGVHLRDEVYKWLSSTATKHGSSAPVYARGMIEDAYDRYRADHPEVTGDE